MAGAISVQNSIAHRTHSSDGLSILACVLAIVYALTVTLALAVGIQLSFEFMLGAPVIALTMACSYSLIQIVGAIDRAAADSGYLRRWLVAVVAGLVLAATFHQFFHPLLIVPLVVFSIGHAIAKKTIALKNMIAVMVISFCVTDTIRTLNYLAAWMNANRLFDSMFMQYDLYFYHLFFGFPLERQGLFPLLDWPWALKLLENSYFLLGIELFALILINVHRRDALARWFSMMFACYFLGVVIFAIFPTVGPFTYYTDTIAPDFHSSATYGLMSGVNAEYQHLQRGEPLCGLGYFVAFPSLHVAMAVLMQICWWKHRGHFWFFLPINVLMASATCFLGFHYFLDLPAGILLAVGVLGATNWLERRMHSRRGRDENGNRRQVLT